MSVKKGTSYIAGRAQVDATPVSGSTNAVSSGGVYTALQGKADASIASTVASLSTAIAAKANDSQVLHTTGNETKNGALFIRGSGWMQIIYNNNLASNTTAPSEWRGVAYAFRANDGSALGVLEHASLVDGNKALYLNIRKGDDSGWGSYSLGLWTTPSGETHTQCPPSDWNNSILTNVALNRGQSGYLKLGNHVMIQWGTWYIGSAGTTVTLPTAFADANYIIGASTETYQMGNTACYNKTTTTFQAWTSDDSSFNAAQLNYIAIGRW